MTARAIVSGALFRAPTSKTSKAGNPYVVATPREGSGEAATWWKLFVFSESAIEQILRLGGGDPIGVSGEFDCELYAARRRAAFELEDHRRFGAIGPSQAQAEN